MARVTSLGYTTNECKPVRTAIRLGHPDDDRQIRQKFHKIQCGEYCVYDFGPNVRVRIRNIKGIYDYRAPKKGDWFVRFEDGTFRIMSPEAYNRFLHIKKPQ